MTQPFGVRFGAPTSTGMTVEILSQTNEDVSLTVDGNVYSGITMSAVGADRTQNDDSGSKIAAYFGTQVVTLSKRNENYAWSATQGANTRSGVVPSFPDIGQDFAFALTTCFNPTRGEPTAWSFLNWYRKNSPVKFFGTIHADDVIYADEGFAKFNYDWWDENGKGLEDWATEGKSVQSEYNFVLMYALWFGVAGPFNQPGGSGVDGTAAEDTDFFELMENSVFMPQRGDHDLESNLGWAGGAALTDYPNAYWLSAGVKAPGITVWETLMVPLHGTTINASHSDAWYVDLGPVRIIAADPTTNAVVGASALGNDQIDDILSLCDGSRPFTIINTSAIAQRDPATDADSIVDRISDDYKDENYIASEYQRLVTDDTTGLMARTSTNGISGNMFIVRGDWHGGGAYWYRAAADVGIAEEQFYEVDLNTVNKSFGGNGRHCVLVEVRGSVYPPEIIVRRFSASQQLGVGTYAALTNFEGENPDNPGYVTIDGTGWWCNFERKFQLWGSDNAGIAVSDPGTTLPSIQVI